jgi:5-methylcytosine-specific restriction endonuclease McrA
MDWEPTASYAVPTTAPTTTRRRLLNTERHALSLSFGHRCAHAKCRVLLPVGWHADHIVPLADGGPDDTANMQPLCPPCHMLKTARENSGRKAAH